MTFPLYINKGFQECFDQLTIKASIDDVKISTMISRAIQKYMIYINGKKEILIPNTEWDIEIDKLSDEELKILDTLISELHGKILDTLWKKK